MYFIDRKEKRMQSIPDQTNAYTEKLILPDGSTLSCRIRTSERARMIRIRILPPEGSVELVLPRRTVPEDAIRFARSKTDWIMRARKTMLQHAAGKNNGRKEDLFPRTLPLRYLGGDFAVEYVFRSCSWTAAKCDPGNRRIIVTGNVLEPERVREALRDMLKRCTADFLIPHFQGLAEKFSFSPGKCTIRIQKGRWGSCSAKGGAISLNAMLLLLPEELVQYILIHELCHLRQMNHSERFWKEVEKFCPDFLIHRQKLRKLEKSLTAYFCEN